MGHRAGAPSLGAGQACACSTIACVPHHAQPHHPQHDVDLCKSRMNTFAYMGDLKNSPEVACVYHSEEAENQYLDNLRKKGGMGAMLGSMAGGQQPGAAAAGEAK